MEPLSRFQNRRGQTSVEFFFLLVFVLFLMTILLGLFTDNLERQQDIRDKIIIDRLAGAWQTEIGLASSGPQEYERTFQIPKGTAGHPIYTKFGSDDSNVSDEIVFRFRSREHLRFLPETIGYQQLASDNFSVLPFQIRVLRECYDSTCQLWLSDATDEIKRPPRSASNKAYWNVTNFSQFEDIFVDYPYVLGSAGSPQTKVGIYNIETDTYIEQGTGLNQDPSDIDYTEGLLFITFESNFKAYTVNNTGLTQIESASASEVVYDEDYIYTVSNKDLRIWQWTGSNLVELINYDFEPDLHPSLQGDSVETYGFKKYRDKLFLERKNYNTTDLDLFTLFVENPFNPRVEGAPMSLTTTNPSSSDPPTQYPRRALQQDNLLYLPYQGSGATAFALYNMSLMDNSNSIYKHPVNLGTVDIPLVGVTPHYYYVWNASGIGNIEVYAVQDTTTSVDTIDLDEQITRFKLFDEGYVALTDDALHIYQHS